MALPSLTLVQQTQFDMEVKAAYQSAGALIPANALYMKTSVIGRFVQFRKVGYVTAVPQAYLDTVTIQDPNFNFATAQINKYVAPTAVDDIQELTNNFDDRAVLASLVGMAIRRQSDQIAINALVASGTTNIIPVNFDGSNTNLTYEKIAQVAATFATNAVPPKDRHIVITGSQDYSLMQEIQFTNNLYSNVALSTINNGTLDGSFSMGMNFHVIPDMVEGGIPTNGSGYRQCFAWAARSLGFAMGKNFETRIDYLPKETSWLVNGIFSAGAIAIDPVGIIEILCDES